MKQRGHPQAMGLSEFAFALSARPGEGDWSVLAVEESISPALVAVHLVEQLRIYDEREIVLVDGKDDAEYILKAIRRIPKGVIILRELENPLSKQTLERLDFARSQLIRKDATVLVLRLSTLQTLVAVAPNWASLLASFVCELAPDAEQLSPDEKEARLCLFAKTLFAVR